MTFEDFLCFLPSDLVVFAVDNSDFMLYRLALYIQRLVRLGVESDADVETCRCACFRFWLRFKVYRPTVPK